MSKTMKVDGKEEVFSFRGIANSNLVEDRYEGLKTSIRNSQPRLALEYVLEILVAQEHRILSLEEQLSKQETVKPTPAKAAPKKREETTDGDNE